MLQITGQASECLSEQTDGTKKFPLQIPSHQAAIFQAFKSTYGTAPRFDASLHTLRLAGGGSHNMGYHALRWEMILHGNAESLASIQCFMCFRIKSLVFCMNTVILWYILHLFGLASYPAGQEWYQCSWHPPTRSGATVRYISHMLNTYNMQNNISKCTFCIICIWAYIAY